MLVDFVSFWNFLSFVWFAYFLRLMTLSNISVWRKDLHNNFLPCVLKLPRVASGTSLPVWALNTEKIDHDVQEFPD